MAQASTCMLAVRISHSHDSGNTMRSKGGNIMNNLSFYNQTIKILPWSADSWIRVNPIHFPTKFVTSICQVDRRILY